MGSVGVGGIGGRIGGFGIETIGEVWGINTDEGELLGMGIEGVMLLVLVAGMEGGMSTPPLDGDGVGKPG